MYIIVGLIWIFSLWLSYVFIKPFIKGVPKAKIIKMVGIFAVVALLAYFIGTYFQERGIPTAFKDGVELVTANPNALSNIGDYESYSYREEEFPKVTDNPAILKVEINGSIATKYLTCTMQKNKSGQWILKKIRVDSLVKKPAN